MARRPIKKAPGRRGRPPKARQKDDQVPKDAAQPAKSEGRRYGPENFPNEEQDDALGIRGLNLPAMNEDQLREFALQHYGRRFAEDDTREYMLRDVMTRMDVSRFARYT